MPVKAKLQLPGRLARQQAQHYYAILQLMKMFLKCAHQSQFSQHFPCTLYYYCLDWSC